MSIKLNLGCFHQVHKGWVNTDITPNIWISRIPFLANLLHRFGIMNQEHYAMHCEGIFKQVRYLDVTRKLPYAGQTVECVFSSHMLEHLYLNQAEHMFLEVYRVLMPRGIFRVVVPDLDHIVSVYQQSNPERFLNAVYEYHGGHGKNSHKWMYTGPSLKDFFERSGFVNVRICGFKEGLLPDVELMDCREYGSIFVEGVRPQDTQI